MLSWLSIFVFFIVLNIYLIIGMFTFHYLETENDDVVRSDTRAYKDAILANFTCLSEESLDKLIRVIAYAIDNGIDPTNSSSPSKWELMETFYFSGTIVTTIGYGHITPNTNFGRMFSIIYALFGIPICGILLSALAAKFNQFKDKILEKVYQKLKKKWQRKMFSLVILNIIGMLLFVWIPTLIFLVTENWSYNEALYCCYMTLTTVGFGDYVPGQNPDIAYSKLYKGVRLYWVLLGLVYVTTVIQTISDAFTGEAEKLKEKATSVRFKGTKIGANNERCEISDERGIPAPYNTTY